MLRFGGLPGGVNLFGYARADMGVGEGVRLAAAALEDAGIPFGVHALSTNGVYTETDGSLEPHQSGDYKYSVNLFHVNADQTLYLKKYVPEEALLDRYNIGFWAWELEKFPDAWLPAFDYVDEVWCPSTFAAESVRSETLKPVVVMPHSLPRRIQGQCARESFGLAADKLVFLVVIDFNSFMARKNPEGAIRAFRMAFPAERTDVCLIVKTHGRREFAQERRTLADLSKDDRRIMVIDRMLSRAEMNGLQECADVYVSLHRSEGFGINLAEMMALGKPTIATAYSGNLEFMDHENSLLVPFRLVGVRPGEYPFWESQEWADPDLAVAAEHMQRLANDPSLRKEMGACGMRSVNQRLSRKVVGGFMHNRLESLGIL